MRDPEKFQGLEFCGTRVRVVPRDADNVFVHGKAGIIEHTDGRTYAFVGSVNDSVSAFRHAYEILWGDNDAGAADWVRQEFEHFWSQGVDLPDAVVKHVAAMGSRIEYRSIEAARDAAGGVPADAVLAERPIYRGGQILRSWQKRFVQTCVEDHKLHGKARYCSPTTWVSVRRCQWRQRRWCSRFLMTSPS